MSSFFPCIRPIRFLASIKQYHHAYSTTAQHPLTPSLKILFCSKHFSEGKPWEPLANTTFRPHHIRTCTAADLHQTLSTWRPDVLVPWWHTIDHHLLDRASSLTLIHQFGVGLDNVDVPAATRNGIWVTRLPANGTGNADTVAEHAVLLMLALSRRLPLAVQVVRNGGPFGQPYGMGMIEKTVCIVGLGDIGRALASRLSTWRMRITAVRHRPELGTPPELRDAIDIVYPTSELHRAIAEADYVVSAVKYDRARNRRLFDAAAFKAMKPGAIFVNVARGGLVDEEALADALETGSVGGAGLDVFEREPLDTRSRLLVLSNVIATPHSAGVTDSFYEMGARVFAENVARFARGEMVKYAVNRPETPRKALREMGEEDDAVVLSIND
ncbi:D-isomer specific 2-hydroxyacid dehydrogenase [Jimgerdemannia flammicorona]|uniref:D-isomer specific 2-hydroxyacid dehydrogenase n=1 Tax=Jimgerdemannia flammicorona TaxID=994334 RepID=A0A433CW02_9FUNG|nr:D-isomer specific 2-hydroxyacid dehydrogenase [Jimgerdemannia flammicorona]